MMRKRRGRTKNKMWQISRVKGKREEGMQRCVRRKREVKGGKMTR